MGLKEMLKAKGMTPAAASGAPVATAAQAAAAVARAPTSAPRDATPVDLHAMFAGMGEAKASFAANYSRSGHYVSKIVRLTAGRSRQKRVFLAIEQVVLVVIDNAEGVGHREGEFYSHMLMQDQDSFLPNVKAFCTAILGCPPELVNQDACVALCEDAQPLAGTLIEWSAKLVPTKSSNGVPVFTRVDYHREVSASELVGILNPKVMASHFPNGLLDRLVAAEALQAAAPEAPAA